MLTDTFSIGETARMFGVPVSTLRYYDKEGLLPGVERAAGGARRFTGKALGALNIVECLKKSGLSIGQIRCFVEMVEQGDSTLTERRELFEKQKTAVAAQIDALRSTLDILEYKCWYYNTAERLGSEEAVAQLSWDELPVELRAVRRSLDSVREQCAAAREGVPVR